MPSEVEEEEEEGSEEAAAAVYSNPQRDSIELGAGDVLGIVEAVSFVLVLSSLVYATANFYPAHRDTMRCGPGRQLVQYG